MRDIVEGMRERLLLSFDAVNDWCATRTGWRLRAAVVLYSSYAGIRLGVDGAYRHFFSGITLGLHELGHILFSWFGQWWSIAGGSLVQWCAPLVAAWHLLARQRDYFGASVCMVWFGLSCIESGRYMADATRQALPLVSLGSEPVHDWTFLLGSAGILDWDDTLGALARALGFSSVAVSCLAGGWMCWSIARTTRRH